jgi:hypothetical protein
MIEERGGGEGITRLKARAGAITMASESLEETIATSGRDSAPPSRTPDKLS